ncbi:hypothetical protein N7536_002736 [Penicillium majusculum]|nr:hypothetical protein N7536_002736 [Penicillium majusculum]
MPATRNRNHRDDTASCSFVSNQEQQLPTDCSSMNTTTTKPGNARHVSNHQILIIGIFAKVYLFDQKTVTKVPRSRSEEDMQPIIRETMIYNTIGIHPRIEECTSRGSGVVDSITSELQSKWFKQILEAVVVIHSFGVIHSDLALRQFFVHLGDFGSSQSPGYPALDYEKTSHCLPRDYELPNTESSDILLWGLPFYKLVAGKAPFIDNIRSSILRLKNDIRGSTFPIFQIINMKISYLAAREGNLQQQRKCSTFIYNHDVSCNACAFLVCDLLIR